MSIRPRPPVRIKTPAIKSKSAPAIKSAPPTAQSQPGAPSVATAKSFLPDTGPDPKKFPAQIQNAATQPYWTPAQMAQMNDQMTQEAIGIANANAPWEYAKAMAPGQKASIEDTRIHSVDNTQNDAIARGLFQSSIKDGRIYDLNTQATMMRQRVDDNITALGNTAKSAIAAIQSGDTARNTTWNLAAIENATNNPTPPGTHPNPNTGLSTSSAGGVGTPGNGADIPSGIPGGQGTNIVDTLPAGSPFHLAAGWRAELGTNGAVVRFIPPGGA